MMDDTRRRVARGTRPHSGPRDPLDIEWDTVIANLKAMLDRIEEK
jgi:hypothetical protein